MRRLLVDSDGTADDLLALLIAARTPEVDVVAITAVAGAVRVSQATENLLYGSELAGLDRTAVYSGCEGPLVRPAVPFDAMYGRTGLGTFTPPKSKGRPESPHAVDAILSLARHYRRDLHVVCLGPLTNLAAALIQFPRLGEVLGQVYVYGGTLREGNVTPAAEYNFYADPEAAALVLRSGLPLTLIPWDTARAALTMRPQDIHRIRAGGTREGRFFLDATRPMAEYCRRTLRLAGSVPGAVVAMAVAVDPAVVLEEIQIRLDVEAHGELTRGAVVADPAGLSRQPANVRLVRACDGDRIREHLFSALGAPPVPEIPSEESPEEVAERSPEPSAESPPA
ncbi:MAG: nucleoside hydrolase [Armatimonadota bacterium]|nr:nucleoside hydrolase [Armatimonadota bacterium]MDR7444997.1 nucleoside hydrolase [Armatimonadota bacterium]MDR7614913.1 nucleoside hydrolase [Armatimonadota bacterium]